MYYRGLIYEPCLHKRARFFITSTGLLYFFRDLSIRLAINICWITRWVGHHLSVPTAVAALHPSNRLWAPVCPDFLWHSQAASVDEKDLTGLPTCWGLRWSPCWITSCPLCQVSFPCHKSVHDAYVLYDASSFVAHTSTSSFIETQLLTNLCSWHHWTMASLIILILLSSERSGMGAILSSMRPTRHRNML